MSEKSKSKSDEQRSNGLPPANLNNAFAAKANDLLANRRGAAPRPAPPSSAEPASGESEDAAPAVTPLQRPLPPPSVPRPPRPSRPHAVAELTPQVETRTVTIAQGTVSFEVPVLGEQGSTQRGLLINVDVEVRRRLEEYQDRCKREQGKAPINGVVIRDAFKHAGQTDSWKRLLDEENGRNGRVVDTSDPLDDLLGTVDGRRSVRGRVKNKTQLSFGPSRQEIATYDAFWEAIGFQDRSAFINALLHDFLPMEVERGRRGRRS